MNRSLQKDILNKIGAQKVPTFSIKIDFNMK